MRGCTRQRLGETGSELGSPVTCLAVTEKPCGFALTAATTLPSGPLRHCRQGVTPREVPRSDPPLKLTVRRHSPPGHYTTCAAITCPSGPDFSGSWESVSHENDYPSCRLFAVLSPSPDLSIPVPPTQALCTRGLSPPPHPRADFLTSSDICGWLTWWGCYGIEWGRPGMLLSVPTTHGPTPTQMSTVPRSATGSDPPVEPP